MKTPNGTNCLVTAQHKEQGRPANDFEDIPPIGNRFLDFWDEDNTCHSTYNDCSKETKMAVTGGRHSLPENNVHNFTAVDQTSKETNDMLSCVETAPPEKKKRKTDLHSNMIHSTRGCTRGC